MKRILINAYEFQNGNVMAFDQFGQQMTEYQGNDALEKIAKDYPGFVVEKKSWERDGSGKSIIYDR